MTGRASALAFTLLLLLGAPATAGTDGRKTYSFAGTVVKTHVVEVLPNGAGAVFAGTIKGRPLGGGAIVNTSKPTGQPNEFSSKGTAFYRDGTLKVSFKNTNVAQPDGSQQFSGSGAITGGTGRFKGAKGTFTMTGASDPQSGIITLTVTGKVTY